MFHSAPCFSVPKAHNFRPTSRLHYLMDRITDANPLQPHQKIGQNSPQFNSQSCKQIGFGEKDVISKYSSIGFKFGTSKRTSAETNPTPGPGHYSFQTGRAAGYRFSLTRSQSQPLLTPGPGQYESVVSSSRGPAHKFGQAHIANRLTNSFSRSRSKSALGRTLSTPGPGSYNLKPMPSKGVKIGKAVKV